MTKMTKEERASRAEEACYKDRESKGVWDWVVQQQDRREGPLVEALTSISMSGGPDGIVQTALNALRAHDRLDAKPEPTLLEAARELVNDRTTFGACASIVCDSAKWTALKAAVEREEGKR